MVYLLAQQAAQQSGNSDGVTLLIAVLLLIAALVFFLAEVFIPSGGILGLVSAGCLVIGVVMLCLVNLTWGLVVAIIAMAALPFAIGFAIKIWPDTPIGRWLTLGKEQEKVNDDEPTENPLVGQEGQAVTDLRPIGTCVVQGKREPCISVRGMIESGQAVRVVGDDGMQLRVELLKD